MILAATPPSRLAAHLIKAPLFLPLSLHPRAFGPLLSSAFSSLPRTRHRCVLHTHTHTHIVTYLNSPSLSPTLELRISGSRNMSETSSLELSRTLKQRILAASSVLRLSPNAFLARLLSQHYNTLGGLPRDLLRYIFTFLDYSTISAILTRVCRIWQDYVVEDPLHFFARLRQMHGIHLLDPVHGLFYFPRALKRVVIESKAGASSPPPAVVAAVSSSSTGSGNPATAASLGADDTRRGLIPVVSSRANALSRETQQQDAGGAKVVPASSFLTVDIRTQNTKSLPWCYARETVQWAIEGERMTYGEVRTPGLQQTEDPVWSQAATVAYDRRIYMFGGETYEGVVLDRAYEYDPMTKHWGVLPALSEKRAAASAVAYRGYIFVFGGYNAEVGVLETYEVLELETRTWISQTYPPQCFYKRQQQQNPRCQQTSMLSDAAAAAKVMRQGKTVIHEDSNDHARITSCSSEAAASSMTWPFSVVQPPERMGSGRRSAVSTQYRMPEKVCGTAVTVHRDVFLFAGGHQSCIAPEQTAVSYSAVNSATTTPMLPVPGGVGDGAGSDIASSTASTSAVNTPQRLPRVGSISVADQPMAESFVWIFCPRTGRWWTQGPRLPSPRAFGAMTVLELPILGPCLCYFGGCAKADTPETAMLYIPLCTAAETRALADAEAQGSIGKVARRSPDASFPSNAVADKVKKKRQEGTGGECFDKAKSPITTPTTTVAGARPRRTAATLTRAEDGAKGGLLRETMGTRGVARKGYRGARTEPAAAVGSDAVIQADLPCTERGTAEAASSTTAGGCRGSPSCRRRTAYEPLQPTSTARTPPKHLHRRGVECLGGVSRLVTDADAGGAFRRSGGNDEGAVLPDKEADMTMIWRCFRNPNELPWQRYVRIPIGGAFTSVVVLGAQHSRSLVLTGFYPAPNIGFCKVNHLLPLDAILPLLGALSPPLTTRIDTEQPPPTDQGTTAAHVQGNTPPAPASSPPTAAGSPPGVVRVAADSPSFPVLPLDPNLQNEATVAVNHWHQEREWNHHQRREIREMVRSAAHAATMRHPRNPQTAGEEHKWSLAPVPEVRVVSRTGPSLLRVSWKVQTLNAKVIVGIE
nr:unnamed protein product [Leishmania braziliensis]